MKFWLSKYALSGGIKEVNVTEKNLSHANPEYVYPDEYYIGFKVRKDIHATYEEAVDAAEKMRLKKIENLKKQVANFERLRF